MTVYTTVYKKTGPFAALNLQIDKNEMTQLRRLGSERGEVSKSDLVGFIKQSKIWKGIMESKAKTCTQPQPIAKVTTLTRSIVSFILINYCQKLRLVLVIADSTHPPTATTYSPWINKKKGRAISWPMRTM